MNKISLCMIVKNGSTTLSRCLESVKDIVNEIIIVDTGSTDNSKEIAFSFGAKVYDYVWNENFSEARNFSIGKASGDWILVLDADEFLDESSKGEIMKFIESSSFIGRLCITSSFLKEGEIHHSRAYISRIFPSGLKYVGKIHEQIFSELPRIDLNVIVHHDGYLNTDKSERNINLLIQEIKKNPKDTYFLFQIGKEHKNKGRHMKAISFFSKAYSFSSNMESYYPNLVVEYLYSLMESGNFKNAFSLINDNKSRLVYFPDFHFACGIFYLKYLTNKKDATFDDLKLIESCFLNCLQLGDTLKYESVFGVGSFMASYNLGLLYEMIGHKEAAKRFYKHSSQFGYSLATKRLLNF